MNSNLFIVTTLLVLAGCSEAVKSTSIGIAVQKCSISGGIDRVYTEGVYRNGDRDVVAHCKDGTKVEFTDKPTRN